MGLRHPQTPGLAPGQAHPPAPSLAGCPPSRTYRVPWVKRTGQTPARLSKGAAAALLSGAVTLRFAKYHGLGNDFVLVEGPLVGPERARRICDRRRGIGADGLVTILPPRTPGAAATMHVYNSDGSVAEMCGNAIRCVAPPPRRAARPRRRRTGSTPTRGRRRAPSTAAPRARSLAVSVEMGPARLEGEQDFAVGAETLHATRVSMGNPHAVLFDARDARAGGRGRARRRAGGGGRRERRLRAAGAGRASTSSSGSAARGSPTPAARARAPRRWRRSAPGRRAAGAPIAVRLPGGTLEITVAPDLARVTMRGPAARVFEGETESLTGDRAHPRRRRRAVLPGALPRGARRGRPPDAGRVLGRGGAAPPRARSTSTSS